MAKRPNGFWIKPAVWALSPPRRDTNRPPPICRNFKSPFKLNCKSRAFKEEGGKRHSAAFPP